MEQLFNACEYLLDRRLAAGDGQRTALVGPSGDYSYAQLHDRVCRTAGGLRAIGVQPEQRILMVMSDSPDFVVVYLAAMRIGAIPVPVSTMLRADGIAELLRDCRARFLAVTSEFAAAAESAAAAAPELAALLLSGGEVSPGGAVCPGGGGGPPPPPPRGGGGGPAPPPPPGG
ncbi:MAG: AMP-binding protein, partial [Trebonia sp.]